MHPKGYKTDYPMCPFGLRITDMQNSGMTIVEPTAKAWGCNPQHVSYIKIAKDGIEYEFGSTYDMAQFVGGGRLVVMQSFNRRGKWHEWKLVEIRRGK